ncbi:MAG: hypothetical protein ACK4VO_07180 [Pseudobdellovibrio sp.]
MKIILFAFFIVSNSAFAARLQIQQNLVIENSDLKSSFNLINQLNAYTLSEKIDDKNKVSVLVLKAKAPTIANKSSIDRIWTQDKPTNKIIKENGCQRIKSAHFECNRIIAKKNKYQAQRLIWIDKKPMVYLMVDHINNSQIASKYVDSFKVLE